MLASGGSSHRQRPKLLFIVESREEKPYPLFASAGLLMLCLTAFYGHDYLGESLEKVSTIVGASLVAASHALNFKLCQC